MNYIIRDFRPVSGDVSCGTKDIPYFLYKIVDKRGLLKYPKDNIYSVPLMLKTIERTIWTF